MTIRATKAPNLSSTIAQHLPLDGQTILAGAVLAGAAYVGVRLWQNWHSPNSVQLAGIEQAQTDMGAATAPPSTSTIASGMTALEAAL